MKGSLQVSYPCDMWLILIITSYPIALQIRTEGSRGKCTCFSPNYRNSRNVARIRVCSGRIVYIYFFQTLEEYARSATDIA